MKPEILLKAFVLHKSQDAFVELVAGTIDEVYSHAFRIVRAPPHLVEETVLQVYWELARKAPRLRKDVLLATWLREHTCKTAVRILYKADRSVDRAALKAERQGLSPTDGVQAAPPGLATRVSQSILINAARNRSLWLFLPRVVWPAWLRPVQVCSGAACVLVAILMWNVPFHRRNQIVMLPDAQLTPASYGQLATPEGGAPEAASQRSNSKRQTSRNQE